MYGFRYQIQPLDVGFIFLDIGLKFRFRFNIILILYMWHGSDMEIAVDFEEIQFGKSLNVSEKQKFTNDIA